MKTKNENLYVILMIVTLHLIYQMFRHNNCKNDKILFDNSVLIHPILPNKSISKDEALYEEQKELESSVKKEQNLNNKLMPIYILW